MDKLPLLTIITVTFNAGRFVDRTLKSVQAAIEQVADKSQVEYLIIDSVSTDATLIVAAGYRDLITRVISEKDKGLYDAMNKGMLHANGRYLWFLNAGDEIASDNVLARLLGSFKTDADVYYSDAMMVREDGAEVGLRSEVTPHTLPKNLKWQDFSLGMKVCHQAFIAKKSITSSYDITNLSADIDWEINCLKSAKEIHYLPFVLCRYLMGGLSVQNHRRSLLDRFTTLSNHFGLFPTLLNHIRIIWRGLTFSRRNGKYW